MSDLTAHIAMLRSLAAPDPQTSMLDLAIIGALEELAEAVDRLAGEGEEPPGMGSV